MNNKIPYVIFNPEDVEVQESGACDLGFFLHCYSPIGDGEQTKQDIILGLKILNDLRELNDKCNETREIATLKDFLEIATRYEI